MKRWGFRERVVLVAVLPAMLIALLLSTYFLLLRYADAEEAFIHRGHSLTALFARLPEYGISSIHSPEFLRLAKLLAEAEYVSGIALHDPAGNPVVRHGALLFPGQPQDLPDGWTDQATDQMHQVFHAKIRRLSPPLNEPPANQALAEPPAGEILGSVTLELARTGMLRQKRMMLFVALAATLISLILGALLALRLSSSVTGPVLAMQQAIDRIRQGDLTARVVPRPDGSLRPLEDGINDMAASLQAGHEQLQSRIATATAELRQKRDEAEQTSIAKSRFLAAASHDLRQPLHALSLFAEELARACSVPAQKRMAQQIGSAVVALEEVLGSLLDVSRADFGAIRPNLQPVDLDRLIERVCLAQIAQARAKGLALRHHPTRHWTLSDPVLLYRMTTNLVANALAHTHRGGILIGVRYSGEALRLEVRDSGIGISLEHQPLVFEEFYQVANPERDPHKGFGLGLAVVSRFARLLGHDIGMRSMPGQGSTFSITLPRIPAPRMHESASAQEEDGARMLLLGATTPEITRLQALLEHWGSEVIRVLPPFSAYATTEMPDLVLCQDDSFVAALPVLRLLAAGANLPVILLGRLPAEVQAMGAGLNIRALARPAQPAKLRALIHFLLDESDPAHAEAMLL